MEACDAIDLTRTLAERQHGVVARRQLLASGVDRGRILRWVRDGRLVPQGRGVYTLGHALLSMEGRWIAAVLVCGEGAVLSHRSAAALWGLREPGGTTIDVTVRVDGPRRRADGIQVHRSSIAGRSFATEVRGIPVTTVAWTLLDLAAVGPRYRVRRALEQAERLELLDMQAIRAAMDASPRRQGSPLLRALLADMAAHGVTRTRSDVEAAFLELCLGHRLPRPQVNHYDNGVEVDFRWPEHRLIAEVDGWAYHRGRAAFQADRARDRRALADGWRVARFTAAEVQREPEAVARELARLLADRWHRGHA